MKRQIVSRFAVFALLVACGGGSKPPQDASQSTSAASKEPEPAAKSGGDGPAASSTSQDVTKGIDALKAGDDNGAKSLFEIAIQKNPKQADAYHYLGVVDEKIGDKSGAEKAYKQALAIDPGLQESAENLMALYVDSQRYDDAVAVAKPALAKNPKNAELTLNYAVALGMKGDQAASTKAFEDAVRLKADDARFWLAYGHQLAAWKKVDEATDKLRKAQALAPDDPGTLAAIAFDMRTVGDFKDCVTLLDKAVKLKDAAELRTYRAWCKLGLKDKAGALADLQDAVAKEPGFAPAHYHLGGALADSGKLKDGIAEWEQYLKLAPNGPLAKQAEAKIKLAKDKMKK